jgi:hypothetical protein
LGWKFTDPTNPMRNIQWQTRGWPNASDPTHAGPYIKVNGNGIPVRLPFNGGSVSWPAGSGSVGRGGPGGGSPGSGISPEPELDEE